MKRNIRTAVSATLILAMASVMVFGLAGCGSASAPAAGDTATVTVSASGTVKLVPDKASVYFGVTTQEATADLAQSKIYNRRRLMQQAARPAQESGGAQ